MLVLLQSMFGFPTTLLSDSAAVEVIRATDVLQRLLSDCRDYFPSDPINTENLHPDFNRPKRTE